MSKNTNLYSWAIFCTAVVGGLVGYFVANRVERDIMNGYREFQGYRDLNIDYQAGHAEELGVPFPGSVPRRTARPALINKSPPYSR